MTDTVPAPLSGVRVIELGNYIAGPSAGRLLADFGADVIKVERPRTGDEIRSWRLNAGDTSLLYRTINRNKRSVALDLRSGTGRDLVRELVSKSDVLVENFRPGTLERWGLSPSVLSELNPDLILVRISAYGQTGPLAERPGFAAVAEAFGGLRELVGDPDRPPVRVGVSIGDSIAGIYGAFGAVMALFQRETKRGAAAIPLDHRIIDVALHEAVFSMMESLLPDYSAHGVVRERVGGRIDGIAPSNAYVCADGSSIVISANSDQIFRHLMVVIDRPDLAEAPQLQLNAGRWARRDDLDQAIGGWASTVPAGTALTALDRAGVPAGPIYSAADILDDEQYAARGMLQRFDVSTGAGVVKDVAFPGIVPVIGSESLPVRSLGPDLGAHTREVLVEVLGKSAAEVDAVLAEMEAGP